MNRLRETRQRVGISQIELAIRCAIHPASLARLEKGVRCTQHTAQRIATALNADVKEVFPDFDTYRAGGAQ
jgi:transcriptional regulator with XRE-family HTH domain